MADNDYYNYGYDYGYDYGYGDYEMGPYWSDLYTTPSETNYSFSDYLSNYGFENAYDFYNPPEGTWTGVPSWAEVSPTQPTDWTKIALQSLIGLGGLAGGLYGSALQQQALSQKSGTQTTQTQYLPETIETGQELGNQLWKLLGIATTQSPATLAYFQRLYEGLSKYGLPIEQLPEQYVAQRAYEAMQMPLAAYYPQALAEARNILEREKALSREDLKRQLESKYGMDLGKYGITNELFQRALLTHEANLLAKDLALRELEAKYQQQALADWLTQQQNLSKLLLLSPESLAMAGTIEQFLPETRQVKKAMSIIPQLLNYLAISRGITPTVTQVEKEAGGAPSIYATLLQLLPVAASSVLSSMK